MNFLKSLLPPFTHEKVAAQGRLVMLQDRFLQSLLLTSVLLGGVAVAQVLPTALQNRAWDLVVLSSVLYLGVVALACLRGKPYAVRAGLYLAIIFLIDIQFLLRTGISVNTLSFFFALIFLAAAFFGIELAASAFALTLAAGITNFVTPGHSWELFTQAFGPGLGAGGWVVSLLALFAIAASAVGSVMILNRELHKSYINEANFKQELEKEQAGIENQLQERTIYFQRRLIQARVAAEISRAASRILDPDRLFPEVVDLMLDRFKVYYIGVFILDPEKKYAVLKAGSGEAGKRMLAEGHRLPTSGNSMIGWAVRNREPRIALDVGLEPVRFNNPHLPYTRSELALPIVNGDKVLGAITIQSTQPNAFDEDDILILFGIADSLSIALENARVYQQTLERIEEARGSNSDTMRRAWSEAGANAGDLNASYEEAETPGTQAVRSHQFPLMLRDQVLGIITIDSEDQELSPEETVFLEAITTQTAIALENARLLDESQRHAFEEQKLNQLTEQFSHASSVEDILKIAVKELGGLPSASEVAIHLIPPQPSGANGHNGRHLQEAV